MGMHKKEIEIEMEESSSSVLSRAQIGQQLMETAVAMFEKAADLPVVIQKDKGNVTVRQTWDGDKMVSVAEAKVVEGLIPADFKAFFERWHEVGCEANDILKESTLVDEVEGLKVCKIIVKTPWPIWNRCLINTFYPFFDREDGSQIFFFSCNGNDELKEKHFTKKDKKNFVLALQFVGGWIISPIKDEAGNVTGSNLKYLNSSDAKGNIPQFIQKSEGPKTAVQPVVGTIDWIRKQKEC